MILNLSKCHYMCIGKNTERDVFKFENLYLENSKEEVILGITIEHLLQANNEITTHERNLQVLMAEVFKIINGFATPIMEDFFLLCENTDNIRNFQIISNESKKSIRYGLHTVKYRTPLLCANLPEKYKTATSLNSFKTKIKSWKCETCVCRLCQTYHQNLRFL